MVKWGCAGSPPTVSLNNQRKPLVVLLSPSSSKMKASEATYLSASAQISSSLGFDMYSLTALRRHTQRRHTGDIYIYICVYAYIYIYIHMYMCIYT